MRRIAIALVLAGLAAAPARAQVPLTGFHYVLGSLCGSSLDVQVDLRSGTIITVRKERPGCNPDRERATRQTRRIGPDQVQTLTGTAEAVWSTGATLPHCPPGGDTQMSLTLMRGSESKHDDYLTPTCLSHEGRMLIDQLAQMTDQP
jgi:hypothetical protein